MVTGDSWPIVEVVNGTVIGPVQSYYSFWTRDGITRIGDGWFGTDDDARLWFKASYPQEYAGGVEMRRHVGNRRGE